MDIQKVYIHDVLELNFFSEKKYNNPYIDGNLEVCFFSPEAKVAKVNGFWDGENNWKIRFAPDCAGTWKWTSVSENVTDIGLHEKSGEFEVMEYRGRNAILEHGFLKIIKNGRGFAHEDGKPFFWLGDTVWGSTAKATCEDWREFIQYRSEQGFNVVCIDALPQYDASSADSFRIPFAMKDKEIDWDRPNYEYFRYLDSLMHIAQKAGMFTAMVALWFDYVPGANLNWGTEKREGLSAAMAARYGSYMAARYAAFGTIWMICGDSDFDNEEAISIYSAAASALKANTPYTPMITAHLQMGLTTPDVLNEKDWFTFHMYQSSHTMNSIKNSISCAEKDRKQFPARPVLNGEPPYENICTYKLLDEKMGRDFVREVMWKSIITGANAGITYGAHGIWNWQCEGEAFEGAENWGMPDNWREALKYAGAEDAVRMKEFFEGLSWWELEPVNDKLKLGDYPDCMASATPDFSVVVVYVKSNKQLRLSLPIDNKYVGTWFRPGCGKRKTAIFEENNNSVLVSTSPWEGDAIILLTLI